MNDETMNDENEISDQERELVRVAVGVTGALLAGDKAGAEYLLDNLRVGDAAFVIASQAALVALALQNPGGTPADAFIRAAGRTLLEGGGQ